MKILLSCLFSVIVNFTFSQECFVVVTSGGGITGVAIVYQIGPDGKVLKGKGLGQINYAEQSNLKKSVARKYYRRTRKVVETSPEFSHPGNIYYSIAVRENGKEMKMTWGDSQHTVPEEAKDLYEEITKVLTGLTFTENTTK
ncbi:MAG: hypothetical protein WD824_05565 [Cyclobacteriaceae bacterium]